MMNIVTMPLFDVTAMFNNQKQLGAQVSAAVNL